MRQCQRARPDIDPQGQVAEHAVADHHVDRKGEAAEVESRSVEIADGQRLIARGVRVAQAQPGEDGLGKSDGIAGSAMPDAAAAST
jgi:hypothetical protein